MSYNEQETRFFLIDPVLRDKGYNEYQWIKMETPAPVEPTGPKGRRRAGSGKTIIAANFLRRLSQSRLSVASVFTTNYCKKMSEA